MQPHITVSLRSTATSFLHDAVTFIFFNPAVYEDAISGMSFVNPGFGLPCAVKIVGFLCQKLHQRSSAVVATSTAAANNGNPSPPPSGASRREVFLSFSLLQRALIACDSDKIVQVPSLMLFIKDDLCSALLRYCRLGYVALAVESSHSRYLNRTPSHLNDVRIRSI